MRLEPKESKDLPRLGICISSFGKGGAETQIWNLIRGICRERFEIHLIQISHHRQRPSVFELTGTRIQIVRASFTLDPRTVWGIAKYARINRLDLLVSFQFMDNQFARAAAALLRIPVISGVRGELPPLLGPYKMFVENLMRRLSTRVVTNSLWSKQKLVEGGWNADRIEVIYNGISTEYLGCSSDQAEARRALNLPQSAHIVGIAARLHPMKDHLTFVRAIAELVRIDPTVIGLIVGGGPEEANIRRWLREYDITENAILAGEVAQNIGQYYRAADVMALTSQYGESFPNVIAEAMTCGVPVVSTDVSGVRELITDDRNGFIVPKKDYRQLAKKTELLLSDKALRDRFSSEGIETASHLSIPAMVERFCALFDRTIDQ